MKKGEIKDCTIEGFWAKDRPDLCAKYVKGHRDVLLDLGISNIGTSENYWIDLDNIFVYMVMVGDMAVAGIRLEFSKPGYLLPFEKVLLKKEPSALDYLKQYDLKSYVESCGLWNSKFMAGTNISIFLSQCLFVPIIKHKVNALFSFNASYTFRIPAHCGCKHITTIGNEGYFNYPTDKFRTGLWMSNTLETMEYATEECIERVFELRKQPTLTRIEKNRYGGMKINYNLKF